jgi:hypothetical protein
VTHLGNSLKDTRRLLLRADASVATGARLVPAHDVYRDSDLAPARAAPFAGQQARCRLAA